MRWLHDFFSCRAAMSSPACLDWAQEVSSQAYSLPCMRPKASEAAISSPLSPLQTQGRAGACLISALYCPRSQLVLGMPLADKSILP